MDCTIILCINNFFQKKTQNISWDLWDKHKLEQNSEEEKIIWHSNILTHFKKKCVACIYIQPGFLGRWKIERKQRRKEKKEERLTQCKLDHEDFLFYFTTLSALRHCNSCNSLFFCFYVSYIIYIDPLSDLFPLNSLCPDPVSVMPWW